MCMVTGIDINDYKKEPFYEPDKSIGVPHRVIVSPVEELPPNHSYLKQRILRRVRQDPNREVGGWFATDGHRTHEVVYKWGTEKSVPSMPSNLPEYLSEARELGMDTLIEHHSHPINNTNQYPNDLKHSEGIDMLAQSQMVDGRFTLLSVITSPDGSSSWYQGRTYQHFPAIPPQDGKIHTPQLYNKFMKSR